LLKTWINPKWRIWIFLALINLLWAVVAWFTADRETWLWIAPIALSINCLLFTYDQVLRFTELTGHPLIGSDAWGILKIVHELSAELKVTPPEVFMIPRHSAQILCYAKTRRRTRLFITQGMVELLTPAQLRAAVTFQMCTIAHQYHILNYWCAALLDLKFRVGKGLERAFAFVFGWTPPLAETLISPGMWFVHLFLLGGRDFQRLDRETARRLEHSEDLAQALWKMEAYTQTRPWSEPWIFAHMCMVSPLTRNRRRGLNVQPALKGRIKTLVGRYPL
jgi:hypothetical protein